MVDADAEKGAKTAAKAQKAATAKSRPHVPDLKINPTASDCVRQKPGGFRRKANGGLVEVRPLNGERSVLG
jgi:hypothetical protein